MSEFERYVHQGEYVSKNTEDDIYISAGKHGLHIETSNCEEYVFINLDKWEAYRAEMDYVVSEYRKSLNEK